MAQSFTDDFVADAIGQVPANWTAVEPGTSEFRARDLLGAHAARLLDAANADVPQGIRDFGFDSLAGYLEIVVRPAQTNAYLAIRTQVKTTGSALTIYFYGTGEIRYVKLNDDGSFNTDQLIQSYSANTDYTIRIEWDVALHHGWRVLINAADKGWLNDNVTQAIDAVEHVRVDGHGATSGTLWTKSLTVNSTSEVNVKPNTPTCTVDSVVGDVANLSSGPFSDPNPGDTHAASRWIVRYAGGGAVVEDTGEDAVNLLTYQTTVPLPANASLEAVVLHKDNGGLWSDESAPAPFSTPAWTGAVRPATAWTGFARPEAGGVGPGRFFTDFTDTNLADWETGGTGAGFSIVDDASAPGGKSLRIVVPNYPGTNLENVWIRPLISLFDASTAQVIEFLMVVRHEGWVLGDPGYIGALLGDVNAAAGWKYSAGFKARQPTSVYLWNSPPVGFGGIEAQATTPVNRVANEWYWLRVLCESRADDVAVDDVVRLRTWADGDPEPAAWQQTFTAQAGIKPSQAGIFCGRDNDGFNVYFGQFSMGLEGAVAPSSGSPWSAPARPVTSWS